MTASLVILLTPAEAASRWYVDALRAGGFDVRVMAVVDKPAVPIDTWLKMTGDTGPQPHCST